MPAQPPIKGWGQQPVHDKGALTKSKKGQGQSPRRKRTPSPVAQSIENRSGGGDDEVNGLNDQLDQLSLQQQPAFKKLRWQLLEGKDKLAVIQGKE